MRAMFRWLLRGLLLALVLLPIALAALLYLCIDEKPLVLRAAVIAPANIERAKRLLPHTTAFSLSTRHYVKQKYTHDCVRTDFELRTFF